MRTASAVLAAASGRIRRLLTDKGGACPRAGHRPDPGDADWLRADLRAFGIVPVIPGTRSQKRPVRHDRVRYRHRWRAEAAFCRLKDSRRVATRYDKLARNYACAVALAADTAF